MNPWIQRSIDYANQSNYLDDLFAVYPTIPDGVREISDTLWANIEESFHSRDDVKLLENLQKLDLFPIKDSYVAYLKRDKKSAQRNSQTVTRLAARLYDMGLETIHACCTEPKETNRQIGPFFRRWLSRGSLGAPYLKAEAFLATQANAVLDASDNEMMNFAKEHLNYTHPKGLDFVARFNGKYVIGEAKFLTDFGGHQNAQFNDAIATLNAKDVHAIKIAILDGVLYIKGKNKMHKDITETYKDQNIMSSLVLREFLHQI